MFIYVKWWSDTPQLVLIYKCLDLLVYAVRKRHAHIRINCIYQYAEYVHIENICAYAENRNRISAWNRIIRNRMAISNSNAYLSPPSPIPPSTWWDLAWWSFWNLWRSRVAASLPRRTPPVGEEIFSVGEDIFPCWRRNIFCWRKYIFCWRISLELYK